MEYKELIDVACSDTGAKVIYCSDEFLLTLLVCSNRVTQFGLMISMMTMANGWMDGKVEEEGMARMTFALFV